MKMFNELNITTADGTLVGILVLPARMTLLVEGEGGNAMPTAQLATTSSVEGQHRIKKVRVFRLPRNETVTRRVRHRYGPLHKIPGVGNRKASPDVIERLRTCNDLYAARKLGRKFNISDTTINRIWYGLAAYAYLGGPAKPNS